MEKIIKNFLPDYSQFWHSFLAVLAIISLIDFRWRKHIGVAFHGIAGGILLFAPFLLHKPMMIGDFDQIHLFLQRFSGAFHIGFALFELRNLIRKDICVVRDETIVYFANALSAAFLVITNLLTAYNLYDTKARGVRISPNFLSSVLMLDGIWFMVECVRMTKQKYTHSDEIDLMCKRTQRWIEGRTSHNTQNLLWIDSALSFFYAFFNFAFPEQLLKAVIHREYIIDGIHMLFVRQFACYTLISAIISLIASNFIIQHQKSYILQRILTQIIIFSLHAYGHFILNIYNTLHVTSFLVAGFYITLLLIIYYRIHSEELQEIVYETENGANRQTVFTYKKTTKTT